jgi:AcrR family transcriptional regulator
MSRAPAIPDDAAREAVLDVADRVFYARGVAGVAMAAIRDDAGISLKRLYGLYPSKGDLVEAWLDRRHTTWTAWFAEATDRIAATGTPSLLATFDAIAEWTASPGYRGCAFVNAAAETTEIDHRHRAVIAAHKSALIDYLTELAADDGHVDPQPVGQMIAVLLDGAMAQTAILGTTEPITAARAAAASILEHHR